MSMLSKKAEWQKEQAGESQDEQQEKDSGNCSNNMEEHLEISKCLKFKTKEGL